MPIISWKDEYSVGIRMIDDEHQQLIEMINNAYDMIVAAKEEDVLPETEQGLVGGMLQYTMTHFTHEEALMSKHGYPESAEHAKEHNDFMNKALSADTGFGTKEWARVAEDLFKYLSDWLTKHILETDMKLGQFLKQKGVE